MSGSLKFFISHSKREIKSVSQVSVLKRLGHRQLTAHIRQKLSCLFLIEKLVSGFIEGHLLIKIKFVLSI